MDSDNLPLVEILYGPPWEQILCNVPLSDLQYKIYVYYQCLAYMSLSVIMGIQITHIGFKNNA